MNQIKNFGDLKTSVQAFINRRDKITLDNIPLFINMAEKQIYRKVDNIPAFETNFLATLDSDGFVTVPANMIKMKHIFRMGTAGSQAGNIQVLTRKSLSLMSTSNNGFARTGEYLWFTPDFKPGDQIFITYLADQKELVDDSDSNILLTIAPDLYLYTALTIAARFNNDDAEYAKWEPLSKEAMADIIEQNEDFEYSGGALVIQKGSISQC